MRTLAAIVLALLGGARLAHAGEPTVRLDDGGEMPACALDAVRGQVIDLLARDPFVDEPDVTVQVSTATTSSGVQATLRTEDGGTRVLDAPDCDTLATSVAVAVMLLLEESDPPVAPPPAFDDEPLPTIEQAIAPQATSTRAPLAADLLIGGAGVISNGDAAAQLVFGARVRRGRWSLGLELALGQADELVVSPTGRIQVSTTPLTLTPCAHAGRVAICATLTGGWTRGTGIGLVDASTATNPFAAVGARAEWAWRVSPRFAVRAYGEANVRLTTTRYLVDEMPVWTSPESETRIGIGVVTQIP